MTDTTTVGQWPDGWWKSVHMHYPPEYAVVRWETGQLAKYNSDNNGMIYEPVHVLTNAEYDALVSERNEWRQRHADCTTSLITADRDIARLKTERDQLRQQVEQLRAEAEEWEDVQPGHCENVMTDRGMKEVRILGDPCDFHEIWQRDSTSWGAFKSICIPHDWRIQRKRGEVGA